MCIATVVVRSRMSLRLPGRWTVRSRSAVAVETHRQTVPTGFSGVPPPGPAGTVLLSCGIGAKRQGYYRQLPKLVGGGESHRFRFAAGTGMVHRIKVSIS